MSQDLPDVPPGFPPRPVGVPRQTAFTRLDDTGEVVGLLTAGNAETLAANLKPGQTAVEGHAPPDTYRKAGAWVARPPKPSPYHEWNKVTKAWFDPSTLDDVRARQWRAVKADRDAAIDKPITVPQGKFDHDQAGRDAILELKARADRLVAAGKDGSAEVTTFDNLTVTLTAAQITNLWEKSDTRKQDALKKGRLLRAQIDAAADAAAVAAVVW